jgi:branched-chain amino acid transport system ATP-binding protein
MQPDHRLLTVQGLNVYYGPAHILQGVDLQVGAEPLALLGRNGMGKTTLCNALMGLVPVAAGHVYFNGKEITNRKPYRISSFGIGYVPQGRRIFPSLSVHEHLRMVAGRAGETDGSLRPASRRRWTVERVYEEFPRLAERRKHGAGQLSGGEQQMLAIGRALLTNPRLLVMDEPSEGLAPVIVDHLLETLTRLSAEGLGILIVEQKLAVATALADRIVIMVSGRIAAQTTAAALLEDVDAQRRYLGVSPKEA